MNTFSASRICILLFTFLFASVQLTAGNEPKKNGKVKTTHANGVKASEGKVKNYQKQGTWKFWYPSGKLERMSVYKNDNLNGLSTKYYDSKQKAVEGNYINGKRDGVWCEWESDGQLRKKNNFTNGQFNGLQQRWYDNNSLHEEAVYQDGLIISRKVWYPSGRLMIVEQYVLGKREGQWRGYEPTGPDSLLSYLRTYSNDKLNGPNIRYLNGRKIEESNYCNGQLHGQLQNWDLNGNLFQVENYTNGQLNGESTYFINGILLRKGSYLNGAKNGMFTENNRDGLLLRHTWYTLDREDSVHSYHPNGKIAVRKSYIQNRFSPYIQDEYDENGNLILHQAWQKDYEDRSWVKFYPNGLIKSQGNYEKGFLSGTYYSYYANGKTLMVMSCDNGINITQPDVFDEKGRKINPKDKRFKELIANNLPEDLTFDTQQKNTLMFIEPLMDYREDYELPFKEVEQNKEGY